MEVVDSDQLPGSIGCANFFHFLSEIGPRRARPSLSYFVNRQSTVEVSPEKSCRFRIVLKH